MASRKDFSYVVGVDTDAGIKNLNALKRATKDALKSAENDFEAGKDDAKAFANAMRELADRSESDLRSTERAVESLGNALGPELRAKIGDGAINRAVDDMRRAGITFEQIEADAVDLADGLKRLDAAADAAANSGLSRLDTSARKLETGMTEVRGESDKTASVMANTVGNASQELASSFGIAGIAGGTLGVTIGQLGEYAAEGGISLGELAKQAGPMIAVTAAVAGISKVIADHKREQQEFRTAVSDTREALAELGATAPKVLFLAQAFEAINDPANSANDELKELGEKAKGAGLSATALATAIALGDETFKRWIIRQADAVGIGEQFRAMMDGQASTQADMTGATQEQIDAYSRLTQIWEQGDDVIRANEQATRDNATAVRDLLSDTKALDSFLQSMAPAPIEELIPPDILREIADELANGGTGAATLARHAKDLGPILGPLGAQAIPSVIDAARNMGDEAQTAGEKIDVLTEAYQRLKGTIDARASYLNLLDTFDDLKEAAGKAYEAAAKGAENADSLARDFEQSALAAQSEVLQWMDDLGTIPPQVASEVLTLMQEGKLDEAKAKLAGLEADREAKVIAEADTTQAELDLLRLQRDRFVKVYGVPGNSSAVIPGVTKNAANGGATVNGVYIPPGINFAGLGGQTGGGTASGGPAAAGVPQRVVEVGRPEVYRAGGQTWLIPPADGSVAPLSAGAGASGVVIDVGGIVVNGFVGSAHELGEAINDALTRWKRGGGTLGFSAP